MIRKWTPEEIVLLRRYYRKKGAKYVAKRVGRSPDAVMAKAAKLGIRSPGIRPWKEGEDRYLQKRYNNKPISAIARALRRSVPSVRGRAKMLNLTEPRSEYWSEKEKELLRELYPDRQNSLEYISGLLNRSRYAILLQAQVLGLKRPQHDHVWTKEEHQYLVKHHKTKSYKEIAQHLGLTVNAVSHHASRSGLQQRPPGRPWTEEEKDFVRQNYKILSTREIAAKLGRTVNAIITIVGPLGVSAGRSRPWSEEEKEYLRRHYGQIAPEKIAAKLDRTVKAIKSAAVKLKLTQPRTGTKQQTRKRTSSGSPYTKKELKFIEDNYYKLKHKEIAEKLGRTVSAIEHIASKRGWIKKEEGAEEE